MSLTDWGTVFAIIVGLAGLAFAWVANDKSKSANGLAQDAVNQAREANTIAAKANAIAQQALDIELGRDHRNELSDSIRLKPSVFEANLKEDSANDGRMLKLKVTNVGKSCRITGALLKAEDGSIHRPVRVNNRGAEKPMDLELHKGQEFTAKFYQLDTRSEFHTGHKSLPDVCFDAEVTVTLTVDGETKDWKLRVGQD